MGSKKFVLGPTKPNIKYVAMSNHALYSEGKSFLQQIEVMMKKCNLIENFRFWSGSEH
jgi:hypothetical protein